MWTGILGALAAALLSSCLIDTNNRCGPNQTFDDDIGCSCVAGAVPKEQGCQLCVANEVAKGSNCECAPGFARNPATKLCEAETVSRCTPACSGDKTRCVPSNDGGGYCAAEGCTSNAACGAGETCALWDKKPYCMRAPLGFGAACTAPTDCTGKDAEFCETFMSHVCLVKDCDLVLQNCPAANKCCAVAFYGVNLCLPADVGCP
jgi:hypothetical protein